MNREPLSDRWMNPKIGETRVYQAVDKDTGTICPMTTHYEQLDRQVGGSHYKDMKIQPVEFIYQNGLGFIEGCVIKHVCRHKKKNGAEDLKKAIHYLELLLALEYGEKEDEPSGSV